MKQLIAYGLLIIFIAVPVAFFKGWLNISWLAFFLIMLGILMLMVAADEVGVADIEAPDVDNSRVQEDYDQPSYTKKIIWDGHNTKPKIVIEVSLFFTPFLNSNN